MKRYQIQALDGWNKLKLNETLEFVVKGNSRTIRVEFNTSDKVALYGSNTKDFADLSFHASVIGSRGYLAEFSRCY